MSGLSEPSDPHLPDIKPKVQSAGDHPYNRQDVCRNVRIDQPIQVMEQEPILVRLDTGPAFEPVLQQRQRTRPRKQFRKDSPDKRPDMQPAKNRARACQQSTEDHPQNEQRMQEEDGNNEYRIQTRGKNG